MYSMTAHCLHGLTGNLPFDYFSPNIRSLICVNKLTSASCVRYICLVSFAVTYFYSISLTEEVVAKPIGNSCGLHVSLQACIMCLKTVEEGRT